jgi:hypothetical protein
MNLRSRNARLVWRGGRAVDRAGLENRKAERSREFESHPLRHLDYGELTLETLSILRSKTSGKPRRKSWIFFMNLRACREWFRLIRFAFQRRQLRETRLGLGRRPTRLLVAIFGSCG